MFEEHKKSYSNSEKGGDGFCPFGVNKKKGKCLVGLKNREREGREHSSFIFVVSNLVRKRGRTKRCKEKK